jgi:hypothetical protein
LHNQLFCLALSTMSTAKLLSLLAISSGLGELYILSVKYEYQYLHILKV